MSAEVFLDTNVLVYSFDRASTAKAGIATMLINEALEKKSGAISWQVIQEFCNLALRTFSHPMTIPECRRYAEAVLLPLCTVWPSAPITMMALDLVSETGFAFYDCLIVASALASGAKKLMTEDMQTGRRVRGIVIENPFL